MLPERQSAQSERSKTKSRGELLSASAVIPTNKGSFDSVRLRLHSAQDDKSGPIPAHRYLALIIQSSNILSS